MHIGTGLATNENFNHYDVVTTILVERLYDHMTLDNILVRIDTIIDILGNINNYQHTKFKKSLTNLIKSGHIHGEILPNGYFRLYIDQHRVGCYYNADDKTIIQLYKDGGCGLVRAYLYILDTYYFEGDTEIIFDNSYSKYYSTLQQHYPHLLKGV